jgi:hypothetical protein
MSFFISQWAKMRRLVVNASKTAWVIAVAILLFGGYWLIRTLHLDADSVAAVASALAAFAAFGAALESRRTAKDSTRALAYATKPQPVVAMTISPDNETGYSAIKVSVENMAVHPLRSGTLSWLLRDGTTGSVPVGEIRGRTSPSVGMFHAPEGIESFSLADCFDDSLEGVDTVTLDYCGESSLTTWRQTIREEWKHNDQVRWRQSQTVPQTSRIQRDRDEVEL